ncbi:hypothetical protein [Mycolicibacterium fortuitum]|uniref:hypothetical protein n=1 Tax=Mycolicibacterium fortuitum TaxID=1766 RepID=UPI00096CBF0B|nr:hypothetical protein [Mycolicibacterium fortuitum]OMC09229.1 hypothetical protein A5734_01695 [Mycolicibacterium fortuitum]
MSETATEATEVMDTESAAPEGDVSDATPEGVQEAETDTGDATENEPETFPRSYVEKLRQENGKYRQRAGEADALAARLHTELVRATGRLADPTDLPFDAEHLEGDGSRLREAIDELLEAKPHLATRRPTGDIGQGQRGPASGSFSLLDMLKERA